MTSERERRNAARRARYAADPEKHRARARDWHRANPEKTKAKNAARYTNPAFLEKHRARENARYAADPAKINARISLWKRLNPDKVKAAKHRRRANLHGAASAGVTHAEWMSLVDRYGSRCAYCGRAGRMTIDHVVPISKGGRDEIANVLPSCRSCNSSKNNKDLNVWLAERGFTVRRPAVIGDGGQSAGAGATA